MARIPNKEELVDKIIAIEELTKEEKTALIGLLRENKRYGIVWEDKPENVELAMQDHIPTLKEVKDRAIISDAHDAPNHIIIEGDNLQALLPLTYTHESKIDVIYIDPPYNTGNKDFIYNDSYVDKDDDYRHSKWLSFMSKRLILAKQLLSDNGVIFISIDDNEQGQLKMLCDEVFGESHFISQSVRKRRDSQANLSHNISPIHEYIFIYSKHIGDVLNKVSANIDENSYKNPDNDPRGPYVTMPCTNKGGSIYSIQTPTGKIITDEWRFKIETYNELLKDNRLVFPKGGNGKPRYKLFLNDKKREGVIANTWWDNVSSNQQGTIELKEIFNKVVFNNPKPLGLLRYCLQLGSSKTSTILDFFAGSGTTLHATMQLNAEDGGKRQCILVTNNENGICENVTYERNKRVIEGYTTPKGYKVESLKDNNLRYYKVDMSVPRNATPQAMRQLMAASTDMLCIKNGVYDEQATFCSQKLKPQFARFFSNEDCQMLIVYDERMIEYLVPLIKANEFASKLKVYVYSPSFDPFTQEWEEVADKVELCAMPQAICDVYRRLLKPKASMQIADEASVEPENAEEQ